MHRAPLIAASAAALALLAAACGGGESSSSYEATRPSDGPARTIAPRTDAPTTAAPPTTGGIDTLPPITTAPATTTAGTTVPATTIAPTTAPVDTTVPVTQPTTPGSVSLTEVWLYDDGYGSYDWGVLFTNPGGAVQDVPLQAVFRDEAGNQVGTDETSIDLALPGPGAYTGYAYDLSSAATTVEVTVGQGDSAEFDVSAGTITTSDITVDANVDEVVGLFTSTYPTDLDSVTFTGVWRGADGKVAYMASNYLSTVLAGGQTWFSLYSADDLGAPSEIYWSPSPSYYEPAPAPANVTITETWLAPADYGGYTWGAVLDNAGTEVSAGVQVKAKVFDADDRLVDSGSGYVTVLPGETATVGTVYSPAAAPARVEIAIVDGGYVDTDPPQGALTFTDIGFTPGGDYSDSITITGTVSSTFAEEQAFASLVLVWRDASNAVTYATSSYPDTIPANGSVPLSIDISGDNVPQAAPTQIYWSV